MNRHLWQRNFYENQTIKWPCPSCDTARLALKNETLHQGQTSQSLTDRRDKEWQPDWIEGRFSCLLKCEQCSESIAVAGRYSLEEWGNPESREIEYLTKFEPLFFMQAPHIIQLPKNLPLIIRKEMEKSFQLYWVDLASCANRIRSSVELLLTELKIKRVVVERKKRRVLTLHARIEIFEQKDKKIAASLFAIKWIGNAGSHSNPLTSEDVLDGYEILEHVFAELFEQRSMRLEKITRQINQSKKPRSIKLNSRY